MLLCFACTSPREESPITVRTWVSPRDDLNVVIHWNGVGDFFFDRSSEPHLERTVEYVLVMRTQNIFSERINIVRQIGIGYDPYTQIYYLDSFEDQSEMHFVDPADLRDYLQSPIALDIPSEELLSLKEKELTIHVRGYVSRLSEDSTFQRWLRIFNPYEYEGYGEVRGVSY